MRPFSRLCHRLPQVFCHYRCKHRLRSILRQPRDNKSTVPQFHYERGRARRRRYLKQWNSGRRQCISTEYAGYARESATQERQADVGRKVPCIYTGDLLRPLGIDIIYYIYMYIQYITCIIYRACDTSIRPQDILCNPCNTKLSCNVYIRVDSTLQLVCQHSGSTR